MGEIYSAASHVLVWLGGLGPLYLNSTKRTLSRIANHARTRMTGREFWLDRLTPICDLDGVEVGGLNSEERNVPALCKFFTAPWFKRLWMVQEVCLAKRVLCCWGRSMLDLDDVLRAGAWLAVASSDQCRPGKPGSCVSITSHLDAREGYITQQFFGSSTGS